jgi:hypothetical protein
MMQTYCLKISALQDRTIQDNTRHKKTKQDKTKGKRKEKKRKKNCLFASLTHNYARSRAMCVGALLREKLNQ